MIKRELALILLAGIILGFSVTMVNNLENLWPSIIMMTSIILINILAKKITAYNLGIKIETKLFEFRRQRAKAKFLRKNILDKAVSPIEFLFGKSIQFGIFLPILIPLLSQGYFIWLACLGFTSTAETHRASRRWGLSKLIDVTEEHEAYIATAGIIATLILAIIGLLTGLNELGRFSAYYALSNTLPILNLDGSKILFGNKFIWALTISLSIVVLIYSFSI